LRWKMAGRSKVIRENLYGQHSTEYTRSPNRKAKKRSNVTGQEWGAKPKTWGKVTTKSSIGNSRSYQPKGKKKKNDGVVSLGDGLTLDR